VSLPPFHWWRTVFFLIPTIAVYTIVLGIVSLVTRPFDRDGHFAHRCARWWARAILATTGVHVELGGVAPPPVTESCIFVSNHASFYDIPTIFATLPQQLRLMAKEDLGRVPFIGWHLRLTGHLLVDRKNPGVSIFKKMQRLTTQGASLLVFAEGSRTRDGRVGKFKGGVFLLAIENGWPIVPLSVVNTRAVMPADRLMTCPANVKLIVHDRIPTQGLTREDARELAARVQAVVASGVPDGSAVPPASETKRRRA
jgi:1-acyl-sn-glycerol-3-phosphate acyltransferase